MIVITPNDRPPIPLATVKPGEVFRFFRDGDTHMRLRGVETPDSVQIADLSNGDVSVASRKQGVFVYPNATLTLEPIQSIPE